MNLETSRQIVENIQIWNLIKILLVGAELFLEDRRTDIQTDRYDEANSRFPQFYEFA
jgi:hypothetical protein